MLNVPASKPIPKFFQCIAIPKLGLKLKLLSTPVEEEVPPFALKETVKEGPQQFSEFPAAFIGDFGPGSLIFPFVFPSVRACWFAVWFIGTHSPFFNINPSGQLIDFVMTASFQLNLPERVAPPFGTVIMILLFCLSIANKLPFAAFEFIIIFDLPKTISTPEPSYW